MKESEGKEDNINRGLGGIKKLACVGYLIESVKLQNSEAYNSLSLIFVQNINLRDL